MPEESVILHRLSKSCYRCRHTSEQIWMNSNNGRRDGFDWTLEAVWSYFERILKFPMYVVIKSKKHRAKNIARSSCNDKNREANVENNTNLGSNLIFLISQPRAGSTLLQRVLGSHPEIHTISEPWIMLHPIYALKEGSGTTEYDSLLASEGLKEFLKHAPEGQQLYISAIRELALVLYGRLLEISGKKIFLDKTPRYHFIIPELHAVFPNGNFIFLLRNPLAVLSSVLEKWFDNQPEWLIQELNYKDLVEGPNHLVAGIKQLGKKAIVVHYEDLVVNPDQVVKDLCNKLGISFYPDMIDYGSHPPLTGYFGDSASIYLHKKPVPDYRHVWKSNLSQSEELLNFAKQYLEKLGPQTVEAMGYSYLDLVKDLQEVAFEDETRSHLTNPSNG
jgi:hypothetical protein